jgi:hypothetical protein
MSTLITAPNIASPDDFYMELLAVHAGCTREESERINTRLILILANHIGDLPVLRDALRLAKPT